MLYNPALKGQGYHSLITVVNAQMFLATPACSHRATVDRKRPRDLFHPDFMRRVWFPVPLSLATIKAPEGFPARIYAATSSEERKIIVRASGSRVRGAGCSGR